MPFEFASDSKEIFDRLSDDNDYDDDEEENDDDDNNDDDNDDFQNPFFYEPPEKNKQIFFDKLTRNLTLDAKNGKLDTVIGRETEITRITEILCRRTKNNPILVGDAGVGKTSVVEGLAQKLATGDVPEFLRGFEIYQIDMNNIVAGTKLRGEFEEQLGAIIDIINTRKNAILFIDEIHSIIGAGTGGNADGHDAASILKPALSKGTIRCIGSTTFEEYSKSIENDRALARRFQKVDILEPSREESIKILKGVAHQYEKFHNIVYSDESIVNAVDLSIQFFPDKRLPDKAIDVIDEAGVYTRLYKKNATVTVNEIKKSVAKSARIPIESINLKTKQNLLNIEDTIKKELFGQDEAIATVCTAVKKARAGFRDMEKPEASFLFVGPTGVGKTELAKTLAKILDVKLLRFDMSEYQESHTISRLIGSPPGYVGFNEGGQLTEAVRKEPHAIILFDEIEKAHEDIYNALLQVLDYGTLTDNRGRKADFRNCMIIFTSNAGARDISKRSVGFGVANPSTSSVPVLKEAVDRTFSPEFRNRLDAVIFFNGLNEESSLNIVRKSIAKISARLKAKKITLEVSDSVIKFISDNGLSAEYGARNIQRFTEEKIASPLIDKILFGELSNGGKIKADLKDEKIVWLKE